MSQLDQLAQHRDAILLAEIAAWLHDDFKHTDQQIHKYVNHAPPPLGRQDTVDLVPDIELDFLDKKIKLSLVKNRKKDDFVDGYLNRCHYTAHIEKEDGSSQQTYPAYLSSPFGFEVYRIPTGLTALLRNNALWSLINNPISNQVDLRDQLQKLFERVGGDTRRPGNEITLWEWGHTVGALYKAALIGAYFQHQLGLTPTIANDLRWQLLGIRTDALAYLTNVSRLPDLEARKNTLQVAIENVRTLLEETYPLATEVYRDENGSLYVVPNLPDLLSLRDEGEGKTLLAYIQEQFATDGELIPQVTLDPKAWYGQDPSFDHNNPYANYTHEIPPAGAMLSSQAKLQSDAFVVSETWEGEQQPVCPICGLRPCVSKQIDYCLVCGEQRKGRVIEWLQDQNKTIWLDEVADSNGRLALITGTFNLTNWLDGSLVETLLVQEPTAVNPAVTKNPSFARLRRIWQTTQTFWHEAQASTNQTLTDARRRLTIQLAKQPNLTPYQVYELDLHGRSRLSVLWDGQHLISTDNLSYTAVQLGIKPKDRQTSADAALAVGAWLEDNKRKSFTLISDDEKNKRFDIQIADIDYQDAEYATAIPILAQPRTFMALVPADEALDIVAAIKTKYEREMGKVRNRLPLHLGLVYFHRRTPLRAALDAGRRMLQYESGTVQDEVWRVTEKSQGPLPDNKKCLAENKLGQFTETITVKLEQNGRSLTWHVPAKMGDGQTPDNWYPYVFIKGDVKGRSRIFEALRPKSDSTTEECWLIHADELKQDDQIYFTPATLDFQWLDSTARRFEIAYDENGRRPNHSVRPYLLDDLSVIQQGWELIGGSDGLSNSQIYALRDLIETKRESWQPTAENWEKDCQGPRYDGNGRVAEEAGMFWQFCHDAVVTAKWKKKPNPEQIDELTNWAVSGLLTDTIELHMGIMKQKPQREDKNNE